MKWVKRGFWLLVGLNAITLILGGFGNTGLLWLPINVGLLVIIRLIAGDQWDDTRR